MSNVQRSPLQIIECCHQLKDSTLDDEVVILADLIRSVADIQWKLLSVFAEILPQDNPERKNLEKLIKADRDFLKEMNED